MLLERKVESLGDLAEAQVSRQTVIRAVNRLDNAAAALARRVMGWRYDMPEAERAKVNAKAKAHVAAVYTGKATALVGDVATFGTARAPLVALRHQIELAMKRYARTLPVWPWVKSVKGFGDLSLAMIVAEAGDLVNYPDVDRLWKRFGLTPYNGHAASTWRRKGGLRADEWELIGYKPTRNAASYADLGIPLMMSQTVARGPYRAVYDREKARFLAAGKTKMHASNHGLRCMRKAAIEDLWRVWNGREPKARAGVEALPAEDMPAAA